jgi:hypothetical protein
MKKERKKEEEREIIIEKEPMIKDLKMDLEREKYLKYKKNEERKKKEKEIEEIERKKVNLD